MPACILEMTQLSNLRPLARALLSKAGPPVRMAPSPAGKGIQVTDNTPPPTPQALCAMDELVAHMLAVAESGDAVSDQPSWRALCGVVRDAAWRIKGEVDRQRPDSALTTCIETSPTNGMEQ